MADKQGGEVNGEVSAAASAPTPGVYAVIDIGTVTCRFLLLRVLPDGETKTLARGYRVCNLGVGVDKTGCLRDDAMARVTSAVEEFLAMRDAFAAQNAFAAPIPTVCVATSAARDAQNAAEFCARIEALGLRLSVIGGAREAALSFAGASMDYAGQAVVVIDVGGGSTEIIAGVGGAAPALARSLDMGCRRITERFLHADPPTAAQLAAARAWALSLAEPFVREVLDAGFADARVVAVAGTATSAVAVEEAMEVYDSARVHGAPVSREVLARLLERFAALDVAERRGVVGLDPKRADVIVGGLVILLAVLDALGAAGYVASETDLLHGTALALAHGEAF